ncbi:hypothetical protein ATW55_01155 [Ferroacidibacillus organovorans]|uniref:Uncharacterized protein n=1 Tax=Ferroacidibacillus organovorans TaxID=1765683 RepID=A0A101XS24_9BACL|nr:hypothetical protein ATW55_01155 [Ferroacidibacillus organovorans]
MNTLRLGPVLPDKPNRIHARVEPHESQDERKSFESSEGDDKARHPVDKGKTKLYTITNLIHCLLIIGTQIEKRRLDPIGRAFSSASAIPISEF